MEKKAKEALQKIGRDVTEGMLVEYEKKNSKTEKVASIIEKVSEEDMGMVKDAQLVGQGMAIGYKQGVSNSIKEASDAIYEATFGMIKKVANDKAAMSRLSKLSSDEFAEGLEGEVAAASGENPDEDMAMKEEIAKGVAPVIIEAIGGEEVLADMAENKPEEFQQVVDTIEQVTEQVGEEIMQEVAAGGGEEPAPGEEPVSPIEEPAEDMPLPGQPLAETPPPPVEEPVPPVE